MKMEKGIEPLLKDKNQKLEEKHQKIDGKWFSRFQKEEGGMKYCRRDVFVPFHALCYPFWENEKEGDGRGGKKQDGKLAQNVYDEEGGVERGGEKDGKVAKSMLADEEEDKIGRKNEKASIFFQEEEGKNKEKQIKLEKGLKPTENSPRNFSRSSLPEEEGGIADKLRGSAFPKYMLAEEGYASEFSVDETVDFKDLEEGKSQVVRCNDAVTSDVSCKVNNTQKPEHVKSSVVNTPSVVEELEKSVWLEDTERDVCLVVEGEGKSASVSVEGVEKDNDMCVEGVEKDNDVCVGVEEDSDVCVGVEKDSDVCVEGVEKHNDVCVGGVEEDSDVCAEGVEKDERVLDEGVNKTAAVLDEAVERDERVLDESINKTAYMLDEDVHAGSCVLDGDLDKEGGRELASSVDKNALVLDECVDTDDSMLGLYADPRVLDEGVNKATSMLDEGASKAASALDEGIIKAGNALDEDAHKTSSVLDTNSATSLLHEDAHGTPNEYKHTLKVNDSKEVELEDEQHLLQKPSDVCVQTEDVERDELVEDTTIQISFEEVISPDKAAAERISSQMINLNELKPLISHHSVNQEEEISSLVRELEEGCKKPKEEALRQSNLYHDEEVKEEEEGMKEPVDSQEDLKAVDAASSTYKEEYNGEAAHIPQVVSSVKNEAHHSGKYYESSSMDVDHPCVQKAEEVKGEAKEVDEVNGGNKVKREAEEAEEMKRKEEAREVKGKADLSKREEQTAKPKAEEADESGEDRKGESVAHILISQERRDCISTATADNEEDEGATSAGELFARKALRQHHNAFIAQAKNSTIPHPPPTTAEYACVLQGLKEQVSSPILTFQKPSDPLEQISPLQLSHEVGAESPSPPELALNEPSLLLKDLYSPAHLSPLPFHPIPPSSPILRVSPPLPSTCLRTPPSYFSYSQNPSTASAALYSPRSPRTPPHGTRLCLPINIRKTSISRSSVGSPAPSLKGLLHSPLLRAFGVLPSYSPPQPVEAVGVTPLTAAHHSPQPVEAVGVVPLISTHQGFSVSSLNFIVRGGFEGYEVDLRVTIGFNQRGIMRFHAAECSGLGSGSRFSPSGAGCVLKSSFCNEQVFDYTRETYTDKTILKLQDYKGEESERKGGRRGFSCYPHLQSMRKRFKLQDVVVCINHNPFSLKILQDGACVCMIGESCGLYWESEGMPDPMSLEEKHDTIASYPSFDAYNSKSNSTLPASPLSLKGLMRNIRSRRQKASPTIADGLTEGSSIRDSGGKALPSSSSYFGKNEEEVGLLQEISARKALKNEEFTAIGMDFKFFNASACYGLCERSADLKLSSSNAPYRFYNSDYFAYPARSSSALYGSIPFLLIVGKEAQSRRLKATGLLWINSSETYVSIDETPGRLTTHWISEGGELDFLLFLGPQLDDVYQQYHVATGLPCMPPLFAIGKHQSRWSYKDEKDVLQLNKHFDDFNIPCDAIWLDIDHTDGKRYFTWDKEVFPHPKDMILKLREKGRKLVMIADPHLKCDENYSLFRDAKAKGLLIKNALGEDFVGECWSGDSCYPDFTDIRVRRWWASQIKDYNEATLNEDVFLWNDMNEPAVFKEEQGLMPKDCVHLNGLKHKEMHNIYGLCNHKSSYFGLLLRVHTQRPFVLTRSFFIGSHRYAFAWTGDNSSTWEDLAYSIPMILNAALCGLSAIGADVGGYLGSPDEELLVRWHQVGIWYPFYREHSHVHSLYREPWLQGDTVMNRLRRCAVTRYRFLPYWYTLFAEYSMGGLPVIRPFWWFSCEDLKALCVQDIFFVGDSILIKVIDKPMSSLSVMKDRKKRMGLSRVSNNTPAVYVHLQLPRIENYFWYNFYTDLRKYPGIYEEEVSMEEIPVYVRSGSILFLRENLEPCGGSSVHAMKKPFTIHVYLHDPSDLKSSVNTASSMREQFATGRVYIDDYQSFQYSEGFFIYKKFAFSDLCLSAEDLSICLPLDKNTGKFSAEEEVSTVFGCTNKELAAHENILGDQSLSVEEIVIHGARSKPARVRYESLMISRDLEFQYVSHKGSYLIRVKNPPGRAMLSTRKAEDDPKWRIRFDVCESEVSQLFM